MELSMKKEYWVGSKNSMCGMGKIYVAGEKVPSEVVENWSKDHIDALMAKGVITDKSPHLDDIADAKTGSMNMKDMPPVQEKENMAEKALKQEAEKKKPGRPALKK